MKHLLHSFLLALSLATASAAASNHASSADLETITRRYREWVLAGPEVDYANPHVAERYALLERQGRRTARSLVKEIDFASPAGLYDTRKTGADQREVDLLIRQVLPQLTLAYRFPGPADDPNLYHRDETLLRLVLASFDRLHSRGFREGMLMPWKAREIEGEVTDRAVIVDFHLRTAGYALATFLMRDELAASGRLKRTLATCRDVLTHDEKFGDPNGLRLNADGVRVVINFALPYALAAGDTARLSLLGRQIERSMAIESNAADTIKPDGLGFHHRGVYLAGYASFAVAQSAFVAWLFNGTSLACSPQTVVNLHHSMAVLRVVSHKYDMHKALAGRLREIEVIPRVLMGYGYLAAIEHPERDAARWMLARLADADFLNRPDAYRAFAPQRNEGPPGPGAIDSFLDTVADATRRGAESPPSGHWALNYGPLSVHRRDDWMVSVKGHSRYLWAFERSLTDARNDERLQNVLGFHDGSASIRIHCQGNPIGSVASGYHRDGWDWTLIPGATSRLIPATELLRLEQAAPGKKLNRPFNRSPFAGGLSFAGRHGLFAMHYHEVSPDRPKDRLRAMKAMFFFDDQIIVISDKIQNGDGRHPVGTTLYQSHLPGTDTPTWVQGRKITRLNGMKRFASGQAVSLVDPVGNGYYIPDAKGLIVRRARQHSLDDTATKTTEGNFAAAWFDHGVLPEQANCEFVILVGSGPEGLSRFARKAKKTYSVLQRSSREIIVAHHSLGLTGYVLPRADTEIPKGMIARVSAPCLAITKQVNENRLDLSVCNPDLGWEAGRQFDYRDKDDPPPTEPVPMPVTLTLRGNWRLAATHPEVVAQAVPADTTIITVATADARSIEFQLIRIP
jgi:chondroitin-sulfate-ABC endolyase/exolyase